MIPSKIAKESESSHQVAFFSYCAVAENHGFSVADRWAKTGEIDASQSDPVRSLQWIHHIPNGGSRGDNAKSRKIQGAKMKAEGVRRGVADIFLPVPMFHEPTQWHGLYIEMKKPALKPKTCRGKGGLEPEQIEFRKHCNEHNFGYAVCYTWEEAVHVLKKYMGGWK